jgi:hypothetical protein
VSTEQCRGDETFPLCLLRRKNNKLGRRQKGLHRRRIYLAAGAASSCPVFSQLFRRISLSTAQGTGGGRERNTKGGEEVERGTLPIPLRNLDWSIMFLSPLSLQIGWPLCSPLPEWYRALLGYYALVLLRGWFDSLFSLILPSLMFVPLQFSWFASWKFVNFTRIFGWVCIFLFLTVLAWDKL